jgi:hypothetical protein
MMHVSLPFSPCQLPTDPAGDRPDIGGEAWGTAAALPASRAAGAFPTPGRRTAPQIVAGEPDDEEEDIGDEEDLTVAQPSADDESNFDDFDDEFDDDFEEEENDPDWDHPDDGDAEPPPGKPPARKK